MQYLTILDNVISALDCTWSIHLKYNSFDIGLLPNYVLVAHSHGMFYKFFTYFGVVILRIICFQNNKHKLFEFEMWFEFAFESSVQELEAAQK